jgi:hypothetical protein
MALCVQHGVHPYASGRCHSQIPCDPGTVIPVTHGPDMGCFALTLPSRGRHYAARSLICAYAHIESARQTTRSQSASTAAAEAKNNKPAPPLIVVA